MHFSLSHTFQSNTAVLTPRRLASLMNAACLLWFRTLQEAAFTNSTCILRCSNYKLRREGAKSTVFLFSFFQDFFYRASRIGEPLFESCASGCELPSSRKREPMVGRGCAPLSSQYSLTAGDGAEKSNLVRVFCKGVTTEGRDRGEAPLPAKSDMSSWEIRGGPWPVEPVSEDVSSFRGATRDMRFKGVDTTEGRDRGEAPLPRDRGEAPLPAKSGMSSWEVRGEPRPGEPVSEDASTNEEFREAKRDKVRESQLEIVSSELLRQKRGIMSREVRP